MSDDAGLHHILNRISEHGAALARHEAEINALRDGEERLEHLLGDLRDDMRGMKSELKEDIGERFDRLSSSLDKLNAQSTRAVSPEMAEELAATQAAESRARAYALALLAALLAALGIIASLIVR